MRGRIVCEVVLFERSCCVRGHVCEVMLHYRVCCKRLCERSCVRSHVTL